MLLKIDDIKKCVTEIYQHTVKFHKDNIPLWQQTTYFHYNDDKLTIVGGTGNIILMYLIPIEHSTTTNNSIEVLVETQKLFNIVRNLKGDVEFKTNDNSELIVSFDKSKLKLQSFPIEERLTYPKKISNKIRSTVDLGCYLKILRKFVSTDTQTPALTMIRFYNNNGVVHADATDKYKVIRMKCDGELNIVNDLLINPFLPLDKGVKYTVAESGAYNVFISDTKIIFQRKEVKDFPNLDFVFNQKTLNSFTFDKDTMADSMKTAFGLLDGSMVTLTLNVSNNILIKARSIINHLDEFTAVIPVLHKDQDITVSFNHTILKDALELITEKNVVINFLDNEHVFFYKNKKMTIGLLSLRID